MLYVVTVDHHGRAWRVRSAFPIPPLRGDFIVYPGRGVGRDDDLLLEVTGRLITAGDFGGTPGLNVRVDRSVPDDDAVELLEALRFTEVGDE